MPAARTIWCTKTYFSRHRFPKGTTPRLREPAHTREYDPPFRIGEGAVYRVPFTRFGLVLGRWGGIEEDDEEAALGAVGGVRLEDIEVDEIREWGETDPEWTAAMIARRALMEAQSLEDLEDDDGVVDEADVPDGGVQQRQLRLEGEDAQADRDASHA